MNIEGLDKAEVLMTLFNASKQQGMGFLDRSGAKDMTIEEARVIVGDGHMDFDYLRGRVMKVDISSDRLETWLYNRDNGVDAAERALSRLAKKADAA